MGTAHSTQHTAIRLNRRAVACTPGQCCCAGSRVMVEEAVYDEFVERSVERAKVGLESPCDLARPGLSGTPSTWPTSRGLRCPQSTGPSPRWTGSRWRRSWGTWSRARPRAPGCSPAAPGTATRASSSRWHTCTPALQLHTYTPAPACYSPRCSATSRMT